MTGLFASLFALRPLSLSLAARGPSVPGGDAVGDCFPVEIVSGAFHAERSAIGIGLSSTGNKARFTAGADG